MIIHDRGEGKEEKKENKTREGGKNYKTIFIKAPLRQGLRVLLVSHIASVSGLISLWKINVCERWTRGWANNQQTKHEKSEQQQIHLHVMCQESEIKKIEIDPDW